MIEKKYYDLLSRHISGAFVDGGIYSSVDIAIENLKDNYQQTMAEAENPIWQKMWNDVKAALEVFLADASDDEMRKLVEYVFGVYSDDNRAFVQNFYHRIFVDQTLPRLSPPPKPPVFPFIRLRPKFNTMLRDFDWIEIPAGKCLTGLSSEQIKSLQERARKEQGFDNLPPREQTLLESAIAKVWEASKKPISNPAFPPRAELSQEEMEIVGSPYRSHNPEDWARNIFLVESILARIPLQEEHFLENFYIMRYPVTSRYGDRGPAEFYWRKDALAVCEKMGARLPSPVEWEKAGRGPDGFLYPWGNEWDPTRGNFTSEAGVPGHPPKQLIVSNACITRVDAFPQGASPYGVMDMAGNLREFTSREGVAKGFNVRNAQKDCLWALYLLANDAGDVATGAKDPLCVRLVLDHWESHLWPGFRDYYRKNEVEK